MFHIDTITTIEFYCQPPTMRPRGLVKVVCAADLLVLTGNGSQRPSFLSQLIIVATYNIHNPNFGHIHTESKCFIL